MSEPTSRDLPIRVPVALIRAGMPIAGVMRYGWTAEFVAFYFWLELVMVGLFFATVSMRECFGQRQFAVKALLFLVGYQVPAIIAGVLLTSGIRHASDKLAYLVSLLANPTLRTAALVQAALTLAAAFSWNYRNADAEA